MADDDPFDEFRPKAAPPPPPDPLASAAPAGPDPFAEFRPQAPPVASHGFFNRAIAGFNHVPRDIVDIFMEGVHQTLHAPGEITGLEKETLQGINAELGPRLEKKLRDSGATPEDAKFEAERIARSMQRQQGMSGLLWGPLQAIASPAFGAYRSFVSRPMEEAYGIPKDVTEGLTMAALAGIGLRGQMTRLKVRPDGSVKAEPIGEMPTDADFKVAAQALSNEPSLGMQIYIPRPPEGIKPGTPEFADWVHKITQQMEPEEAAQALKVLRSKTYDPMQEQHFLATEGSGTSFPPANDNAVVEHNMRRLWNEDGIHPAEAAHDAPLDPFLRDDLTRPIDRPRITIPKDISPEIDAVLDSEVTRRAIEHAEVDREHTVPYTAGGSVPLENPTMFIDYRFPKQFTVRRASDPSATVTFDPAEPFAIHENLEQHVMDLLIKGGMKAEEAYRVAHFEYAEPAEGAWYRAHDIDQAAAEATYAPIMEEIQKTPGEKPTPTNLYSRPYPHDSPSAAAHEAIDEARPTAAEIAQAQDILASAPAPKPPTAKAIVARIDAGMGAPPRSAALAPNGLPRSMYPPPPGGAAPPGLPAPPGTPPPPGWSPTVGAAFIPGTPLAPPRRPPFFTYDDRNAFAKAFSAVVKGWQKTFQPELVSDAALQADPRFAQYKAASQNLKDQIVHNQEADYQFWRKQSEVDRLAYLQGFETGNVAPQWRARADVHKQMMQKAHQMELQAGSQADYFENYFPHLFQSPEQAVTWMKGKTAQVGPTWFQKERTFSTIREAMDAGLRLTSTNPEYLITHRLFSTADMIERMSLLHHMKDMGLGIPVAEARAQRAQRIAIAQQLGFPIDVTTIGRDLSAEGWEIINAPGGTGRSTASGGHLADDRQWFIAPDIRPLWQNAMNAKGLWGNEGAAGTTFRGWMSFKNVWVPIKLAVSAFHPLHVAHINMTGHIVQALREATSGQYGKALREIGDIVYDPIAAAIPKLTHEGRFAREAWLVPEDARTPLQQTVVKVMEEGGLVANISEQLKIDSQRKLEEAWDKQQWFRMAPQLVRETIRRTSAPVFEHWIPNLKVAAYLREVASFAERHPQILNDDIQRGVAFRTIAKSIENRYGEMFYGNLFWNRTLKDIGIGSFLSLGWNTGFVREFGGALTGPMARGVRGVMRGPTQTEQTIHQAQSKAAYATAYMGGAMMINGIITYANTGEEPEGMDWVFPRIGRNNPDGTPHRLTNMFYTRELPMVKKHIEGSGSVLGGVADTLYGKLVVGPLVELARNKDYYGNEIWSEGNPLYKRGAQVIQHTFGEQFNPISVAGARQAMKTGGGWDEAALAMIGFGPAPSYANKTSTQNMVEHLFQRFVAPEARPQEMGVQAKERGDIRSEILLAQQRGDDLAVKAGAQKWFKAGGSRQGLSNILLHIPPDVSMFRALPEIAQRQVMEQAPPEEAGKYKPYLKSDTASRVADLQIEALAASGAGDQEGAERIAAQIQTVLSEAVHSGRITNLAEFQRSVQQNMMFRLQPQSAAEKGDRGRQKRLMMQPGAP